MLFPTPIFSTADFEKIIWEFPSFAFEISPGDLTKFRSNFSVPQDWSSACVKYNVNSYIELLSAWMLNVLSEYSKFHL